MNKQSGPLAKTLLRMCKIAAARNEKVRIYHIELYRICWRMQQSQGKKLKYEQ